MVRLKPDPTASMGTSTSVGSAFRRTLPAVKFAVFGRFRARKERFGHGPRAARERELAGIAIDLGERDAFGNLELDTGPPRGRAFHELRPDGQRRLAAAE